MRKNIQKWRFSRVFRQLYEFFIIFIGGAKEAPVYAFALWFHYSLAHVPSEETIHAAVQWTVPKVLFYDALHKRSDTAGRQKQNSRVVDTRAAEAVAIKTHHHLWW